MADWWMDDKFKFSADICTSDFASAVIKCFKSSGLDQCSLTSL